MTAEAEGGRAGFPAFVLVAVALSVLFGFRIGVNRQDIVGYGLQVPAPGLDLSYTYTMNRAATGGEAFGRDFVSTYGPLGPLIAPMDVGGVVPWWIASQGILVIGLAVAAAAQVAGAPGARGKAASFLGLGALLFAAHLQSDESRWLCFVVLLVLLAVQGPPRVAMAAFLTASVLAGAFVLVKLSLGMGGLALVAWSALFSGRPRTVVVRLLASGAGALLGATVGLLAHQGSLLGAADYLRTASAVSAGYSWAMGVTPPGSWKVALAFLLFLGLLVLFGILSGSKRARVSLAILAVPLALTWKHALVRQDVHVLIFVAFGLFAAAVVAVDAAEVRPRWRIASFVGALFALLHPLGDPALPPVRYSAGILLGPASVPGASGLVTLFRLAAHRATLAAESTETLASLRLTDEGRTLIGDSPVDVYPWESVYTIPNALNWRHRPSPASFATYTPDLDRRNAAFFAEASRPPFVLWHRTMGDRSIDRRHLFWDEPMTLLTLLDRYDLARAEGALVLGARAAPRFGPRRKAAVIEAPWGEWVPLPRGRGALLAEVAISDTWPARVHRAMLREPETWVMVRFTNGGRSRYRYVSSQARSGLLVDPLPRHTDDVAALFRGECRTRVEALRFLPPEGPSLPPSPRLTLWRVDAGDDWPCE